VNIKLYASNTCARCKQLKKLLQEKNIEYEEINYTEYMLSIGIRGNLPLLQIDDGPKMPFFEAYPKIKRM
jgi:glutathione S-transferase